MDGYGVVLLFSSGGKEACFCLISEYWKNEFNVWRNIRRNCFSPEGLQLKTVGDYWAAD